MMNDILFEEAFWAIKQSYNPNKQYIWHRCATINPYVRYGSRFDNKWCLIVSGRCPVCLEKIPDNVRTLYTLLSGDVIDDDKLYIYRVETK